MNLTVDSSRADWRGLLIWTFTGSTLAASFSQGARQWDPSTLRSVASVAVVCFSPAVLVYVIQLHRRSIAVNRGGPVEAILVQPSPGRLPVPVTIALLVAIFSVPALIFTFTDADVVVKMLLCFAGFIVFAIVSLRYDSLPAELRSEGIVVDGFQFIAWHTIDACYVEKHRPNVLRLAHQGRITKLFVDMKEVSDATALIHEKQQQTRLSGRSADPSPMS